MIKAKQLADRLPTELLPKTKSCAALLSAVTQLKVERNNAMQRANELEIAVRDLALVLQEWEPDHSTGEELAKWAKAEALIRS